MTTFEYLSVLLSIILGLAITQVLEGYRALLLARRRVRWRVLPLLWSVLILLFAVQSWWASFGLRSHVDWSFASFLVVMAQMMLLYLMAAVVLPDAGDGATIDLTAHYEAQRLPFFACLLTVLGVSLVKDRMIDGAWPDPRNIAFHAAFATMAVVGLIVRDRRVHMALAVLVSSLFGLYVWLLFARL